MTTTASGEGVSDNHVVVPFPAATGAPSRHAATLSFNNGLSRVELGADAALEGLLDALFNEPVPVVWTVDHSIHIEYPLGARLLRWTGQNTIRINPRVSWLLEVHGDIERLHADLSGVDVRSIAAHAGAAHTRLVLGRPAGTCRIRATSVTNLRVERPAHVPVRVEIAGTVTDLTLDSQTVGAVTGGLHAQTPGYDAASARYLVIVSGAADALTCSERT